MKQFLLNRLLVQLCVKATAAVVVSAALILGMGSCNNNPTQDVIPVNKVNSSEFMSVIDQMEQEEGVKFFKRDIWFEDKASRTKILMRFASKDESELNYNLEAYEYSVKPVFESENNDVSSNIDKKQTPDISIVSQKISQAAGIICEPIVLDLKNGAIGYRIHVGIKPISSSTGRIKYQDSFWQHVSHNHPNKWKLKVQNKTSPNDYNFVNVGLEYRHHWYSSWLPFYPWRQFGSYSDATQTYGEFSAGNGQFNKVIARVCYDPIGVVNPQLGFELWFY
jgi:hypothetical protein